MTEPRRRTSFGPTVVVGLAASVLATVAATQPWASATTRSPGLRSVVAEGADVAPGVLPLALVALAAWGTVLVLRRRGRRVVAVVGLLAAMGAAVSVAVLAPTSGAVAARLLGASSEVTTDTTAWPLVAGAGSLVAGLAFLAAFVKAPRWPEMSARYDAPGTQPSGERQGPMTDTELWKALDEGHDPTLTEGGRRITDP